MKSDLNITYFKPDRQGVFLAENSVKFAAYLLTKKECGVVLYDKKGNARHIPFRDEGKRGTLYGLQIEGDDLASYTYNYYIDDRIITDSYAQEVRGLEKWGSGKEKKRNTYGVLAHHAFDWQGDKPLMIPPEDSILYGINVRAFTMHKSSGVKNKGTFEGVVEKIPYLKELGITSVELMPCYEYDECILQENHLYKPFAKETAARTAALAAGRTVPAPETEAARLNCWGFQNGFYFAPKAAYSAVKSPSVSFKKLVREFHKNGIEVMMQFYFPPEIRQLYMLDVIKYWVMEYHIDGVRISGFHIPFRLLAEEPILKNTKIWCSYLPEEDFSVIANPVFKNFLSDNNNFRYDIRRFLKGDEGLLNQAIYYQRRNPSEHGVVNYLADYDGFSLYDCVSYERKHNEDNGEGNRDGIDVNLTWNCGIEGETRRKSVLDLRLKQIKNALSFVFLSQGIPFIFSGDEFASSRGGNNNCYCQDNETGWVNWKNTLFSREVLAYTRFLIGLRKSHDILHMKEEMRVMDYKGLGYPDISYHGAEAWRPDLSYIGRMIGIVLNGQYAPGEEDASFYIAYNMHWEPHKLALPTLSNGEKWTKLSDTSLSTEVSTEQSASPIEDFVVTVSSRSISVFMTRKCVPAHGKNVKRKATAKRKERQAKA